MTPADDVVPDRLAEELRREARRIGSSRLSDLALISADEVERLRAENAPLKQSNARFFDDVVALRGALQALVDATDKAALGMRHCADLGACPDWNDEAKKVDEARAVAVAVLTGQEPT